MFSCDPSENFSNSFFTEHLQIAAKDFADIILTFIAKTLFTTTGADFA